MITPETRFWQLTGFNEDEIKNLVRVPFVLWFHDLIQLDVHRLQYQESLRGPHVR